ncbi:hypothetical protein CYMTET_41409 [Cymbomonas tetramitiformis]|uniref:Uncharacterized protein n=1 Tax=Cymbomonas tetramitiformis TaxID=36881 RepID=A0AAE0C628_9CHLO|nr:hypothetical protein CYMTET_41409 [Cymbomonas tetramitiformis]
MKISSGLFFVVCAAFSIVAVSQSFTDSEDTQTSSHQALVCGTPSVESVQVDNNKNEIHTVFHIPLPTPNTDEIGFGLFFGTLAMANEKLGGTKPLTQLDFIMDPSETAFSANITDKCDVNYENQAAAESNSIKDDRLVPPKTIGMIAHERRCLQTRYPESDVDWTSFVETNPLNSGNCGLGISKWHLRFNIARWLSAGNMNANSVSKQLVNGGQLYTFPLRIFMTAIPKNTGIPETFYSSYQFKLFKKSTVFAALSVSETNLNGFTAYFIQDFVQKMGDPTLLATGPFSTSPNNENLIKLEFNLVFFKETASGTVPTIEMELNNLVLKIADDPSPFELTDETGMGQSGGINCLTIGSDASSITRDQAPTQVNQSELIFANGVASSNGVFYKESLSIVCYVRVHENSSPLAGNARKVVPLRLEYTHTYTDQNTDALLTSPTRDPIAIFTQDINFEKLKKFVYATPLKAQIYKIPQSKISSIDRRTWTENDVRTAMVNAFGTTDIPRQALSVSVETPVIGAVTLDNAGDMGNFNLKMISAFIMANSVSSQSFVSFAQEDSNVPESTISNPCNLVSYYALGNLIGLSTLYSDTQSDSYTERLEAPVKELLENTNSQSFYAGNSLFEINPNLKTKAFTSNYLLQDAFGAQDVLFVPFLPKFRIANGLAIDTYETRLCMIVEVEPYTGGNLPSARRLLAVEARDTTDREANTLETKFTITTADFRSSDTSGSDAASDDTSVDNVDAEDNDESFTNTNWTLSIVLITFVVTSAAIIIVIVVLSILIKKKNHDEMQKESEK